MPGPRYGRVHIVYRGQRMGASGHRYRDFDLFIGESPT